MQLLLEHGDLAPVRQLDRDGDGGLRRLRPAPLVIPGRCGGRRCVACSGVDLRMRPVRLTVRVIFLYKSLAIMNLALDYQLSCGALR
jgi:hypothetical protein